MKFLVFTLLEVYIFSLFVDYYGFWESLLIYFIPSVFGMLIISIYGRASMMALQMKLAKGEEPTGSLLNTAAIFIGGLMLIPPSMILRFFALILILPGIRHLFLFLAKSFFLAKIISKIKTNQFGNGFFYMGSFGSGDFYQTQNRPPEERDVSVIDVEAIDVSKPQIENTNKNEEGSK